MSEKGAIFQIAHFSLKKKERSLSFNMNKDWATHSLICSIAHRSFSKERLCNRLLNRSLKKSQ